MAHQLPPEFGRGVVVVLRAQLPGEIVDRGIEVGAVDARLGAQARAVGDAADRQPDAVRAHAGGDRAHREVAVAA